MFSFEKKNLLRLRISMLVKTLSADDTYSNPVCGSSTIFHSSAVEPPYYNFFGGSKDKILQT